jgi:hypothetical protein
MRYSLKWIVGYSIFTVLVCLLVETRSTAQERPLYDVLQTRVDHTYNRTELVHFRHLRTCMVIIDRGIGLHGRGLTSSVVPCPWDVKE